MEENHYIIDATLIEHQLISLNKCFFRSNPEALCSGKNITIKLKIDENTILSFNECHIDNTKQRRLRVPDEVMIWIRMNYAFSVAYFSSQGKGKRAGVWKKADVKKFFDVINKKTGKQIKMDIPGETIVISWVDDGYLLISKGFSLDEKNVTEYLTSDAIVSVLPYIFSSVKNISYLNPKENEYSRAVTPQVRQAGNRLSGLTETAYASLLA